MLAKAPLGRSCWMSHCQVGFVERISRVLMKLPFRGPCKRSLDLHHNGWTGWFHGLFSWWNRLGLHCYWPSPRRSCSCCFHGGYFHIHHLCDRNDNELSRNSFVENRSTTSKATGFSGRWSWRANRTGTGTRSNWNGWSRDRRFEQNEQEHFLRFDG